MSDDTQEVKPEAVDTALSDMKLEESEDGVVDSIDVDGTTEHTITPTETKISRSSSLEQSASGTSTVQTPKSEVNENEEILGSEIALKVEAGKAPKLSRKASQKVVSRPAPLFGHFPDATVEAVATFQVIRDCIYGSKYMGSSEHDALGCDCSEEWRDGSNHACGEDSDCINRATKMECIDDECNCGTACQNQRFQRKEFANVSVIKTEKKGYGLRTDSDLQPNDFIFEYIGEVINEPTFRRRMVQYDEEGIKHFYFMSLTKSEFVDATKKGNLGRFCNHSCNPNCYVDKWVVGDKLRMGIFAERHIKAGEELVFNYNVDRYGADPQPCYCAEPNCTGFIGGKTQTERATKLSHATIEALGIDDGDGWDTAVAKRPRKKKTGEDDEEYVNNIQPKGLDEDGVTKVMATLMQCKEKWIAVKLLSRIQRCDDDRVRNRVVRMHGYQILRTTLTTWIDDSNVVLQVLDILYKFPRLTKNKISDSKIEATIETLKHSEHKDVAFEGSRLLEEWSKLEVAYRIPRKKFDPNAQANQFDDRRGGDREEEASKSPASTAPIVAPTGPRNAAPQRNTGFYGPSRPAPIRRPFGSLPPGWFTAQDGSGNTYYYSKSGQTTWQRPNLPAAEPPPPPKVPPKVVQNQKALQDIIDSLTKPDTNPKTPSSNTPQRSEDTSKDKKKTEKWRSLPVEKQMKLYENTLFPHIKYVMDKFRNKLPKDDLKKFAKEIGKKLVASDFKHNRVEDPTKIDAKIEKKVKKYVKDFFDKAVAKKAAHDKLKATKKSQSTSSSNGTKEVSNGTPSAAIEPDLDSAMTVVPSEDVEMSDGGEDDELIAPSVPGTPAETPSDEGLKRKRDDLGELYDSTPSETPMKRIKEDELDTQPSPPPPPPPPPAEDLVMQMDEEADLRAQEEALMRENEEALIRENEEAMRDAERLKKDADTPLPGSIDDVDAKVNGVMTEEEEQSDVKVKAEDHDKLSLGLEQDCAMKEVNGNAVNGNSVLKLESGVGASASSSDLENTNSLELDEKRDSIARERKEVLSH